MTILTPIDGGRRKRAAGQAPRPADLTEDALALRFAEKHKGELRYVAQWSRWMRFNGRRWSAERTRLGFDLARAICRDAAAQCTNDRLAAQLASAKVVAAVERLAQADRQLAAIVEQWDADPWLLNTPKGIIDLRTGERQPNRPDAYMTRMTAVGSGGKCPLFRAFLDRVTDGDTELQSFLQRHAGYNLTGSTREQVMLFVHGYGANGKSVYVNTLQGVLGDYHRAAPIETFTASSIERHPTDPAALHGARLVTAVETEEGRRWAESKIKALTGGDTITARFMRQDFFEFTPQFKLMIAGNHRPGLRSVDEAIRRRFHLVEFHVTIPPEERDHNLTAKLRCEWPGILEWMIEGCIDWQERGLAPPQSVLDATAAYLDAQDAFSAWIDEACMRDPNGWERTAALFASWRAWADRSGEPAGSLPRFKERFEARDFTPKRIRTGDRGYAGVRLKSVSEPSLYDAHHDR